MGSRGRTWMGLRVSGYMLDTDEVPDWVYSESRKKAAKEKWIDGPKRTGNFKMLREGQARYYGHYHNSSGLVYDEWDREVHWIDPEQIEIPTNATKYRAVDHGTHNPTACIWAAAFPNPKAPEETIYVVYKTYSHKDRTIDQNAVAIIEASGNTRKKEADEYSAGDWEQWVEVCKVERYHKSVLDSRSFATHDASTNREIGWLYKASGLRVQAASGRHFDHSVPVVKDMLRIRKERTHPITGKKGAPMLYVLADARNAHFVEEIEHYVWEEYTSGADDKNVKERPKKLNDHVMSCLQYLCQIPMRYYGDEFVPDGSPDEGGYTHVQRHGKRPKRKGPRRSY